MAKDTSDKIRAASAESKKSASSSRFHQTKLSFESLSQPSQSQNKKVDDVPQALGGKWTITRTKAREQYRLSNEDLKDLPSESKPTRPEEGKESRTMVLYKERDVEQRAWDRHGGKGQFINYLKMLLKKHNARKNSDGEKTFKLPSAYRKDVLGRPTTTPGSSQSSQPSEPAQSQSQTETIPLSPALTEIKNSMAPRFWDLFVKELERWERYYKSKGRKPLGTHRWETAMGRAQIFVATYPPRPPPTHVPTESPWMRALRKTLAEAPRISPDSEDPLEGIVYFGRTPIGSTLTSLYDWNDAYLLRVFAAMAAVVDAHGLEEVGWASARWEVYDTYVACFGSIIIYNPKRKQWFDPAARWLEDEYRLRGPSRDYLQTETGREPVFSKLPSPTYRSAAGGASSM